MVVFIAPQSTIADAWIETVRQVDTLGGHAPHVVTTVLDPLGVDESGVRTAVDDALKSKGAQSIDTVAGTIFSSLYVDPGFTWSKDLTDDEKARVDAAAEELYENYGSIITDITSIRDNSRGTYFSRMMSFPGKAPGGHNQLKRQIEKLRREFEGPHHTFNVSDISIGLDGNDVPVLDGLQTYRAEDNSPYGFPCLVHIDLSVVEDQLNILAVYRHQFLLTKAYGNLVGLSRLLGFLCQQSGFAPGELTVVAGMSDCETREWTGELAAAQVLGRAEAARP